jgi:ribonucleoside-diphosphate reductase alpha chain
MDVSQPLFGTPKHHAPSRRRLPAERAGIVHKFAVGGFEGYIRCGLYEDGTLGEVFIKTSKAGSTLSGMMDGFATAISIALQYGVPLEVFADKFIGTRFEPFGFTGNKEISEASSLLDYIFRYLIMRFGKAQNGSSNGSSNGNENGNGGGHDGSEGKAP